MPNDEPNRRTIVGREIVVIWEHKAVDSILSLRAAPGRAGLISSRPIEPNSDHPGRPTC
jgi:hypothetical protein